MAPYYKGIIIGLTFAILLGPGFFALIQTSIHRGFKSGALMAIGIFISDVVALLICYFGITQIPGEDPRQNFLFGIVGGIVLIIFGTYTFTRVVRDSGENREGKNQSGASPAFVYIIKGFFLNITNPGMWFIWITVTVSVRANFGIYNNSIPLFLGGILSTILFTDMLKCFIAHHIKSFLNGKIMTWMNRIVGIILVVFGTYLILNVLFDLENIFFRNG
ncbi:MAG: LysE family transporter [Bacteroidales bacterium]|nr:LysE family transporter [Bacteroidales bacterium]